MFTRQADGCGCMQEAALRHQDLDAAALERSCSSPGTSSDGSDGEGKSAVVVLPLVGVDESSKVDCPAVQQDPDRYKPCLWQLHGTCMQ